MSARELITHARQGVKAPPGAMEALANGLVSGQVSDAQAGAFAMAVCLKGLAAADRVALTRAMRDSGATLEWQPGAPVVDKHSTGGLGDCTSLVLAPALAACGARVPMISGRGLGHTGGTLDKLGAIPGLMTDLPLDRFQNIVNDIGCAIVGANASIAPADRRLYAIRDISATVDSVDLICASILSKKLAAALQGLVLDVKAGSGAFASSVDAAGNLARALVSTASMLGCPATALITDMGAPLAPALGNACEVACAMQVLAGGGEGRLRQLVVALGAELLAATALARDTQDGARQIASALGSGAAAERFERMVAAQGGPKGIVDGYQRHLPCAPTIQTVTVAKGGYLAGWHGQQLGWTVVALGAGRMAEGDVVDPAVGITAIPPVGSRLAVGDRFAEIHARNQAGARQAALTLLKAAIISDDKPVPKPLVLDRIAG